MLYLEFPNKSHELGGTKITIGIIEKNTRLKEWYLQNGFVHVGNHEYAHLPFVVGYMEMEVW
ncbi:MAG: hypothetical protein A2Y15_05115 [Clostridiales bacterium GWF2_36_10]|nr:MAG: hypothetical protein A2Y15_05115 [Clostridiales bacterium GWF2_36_10]HAN20235.1 hypothetical protein [Clostridiales bacterium]